MRIDVFTLFPAWFDWFLGQRHVRNAADHGHSLETVDLRATTPLGAGQVDDTPYGGGAGMVLRVDVVEAALRARYGGSDRAADAKARDRARGGRPPLRRRPGVGACGEPELTLLCGRYEGFDERVHQHLASDVVSIGPYVLSGGELAAMVVADAVIRKLPGSLGHEESVVEESFSHALEGAPEYPHYTRPADWRGHTVRRSCSPATTRRSASGASRAVANGPREERSPGEERSCIVDPASTGAFLIGRAPYSPLPLAPARPPRWLALSFAPSGSVFTHVRRNRQPGARSTAPRALLPGGGPRSRALPGGRGPAPPDPGLRGSCSSARATGRARRSRSASSRSAWAWSARSRCTRRRSSAWRSPAAARFGGPSCTTCASAWVAARA